MRRKKGGWLPRIVAVLAMLAALLVLANTLLVVRQVSVEGANAISAEEIVRGSGIRMGARMSAVRQAAVREAVESDGRLCFVGLKKRFPSTIVLTVRERSRDALALQGGKVLILDAEGYVVEVAGRLPDEDIPYVTGLKLSGYAEGDRVDDTDGRISCMGAVVEALKANGALGYVSELNLADVNRIQVITRTGMTVQLGDCENMGNKIIWMTGTLADLERRGETLGTLDVSSGTKADYRPPNGYSDGNYEPTPTPVPEIQVQGTPAPTPEPTQSLSVEEQWEKFFGEN